MLAKAIVGAAGILALTAGTVSAQSACTERSNLIGQLAQQYSEEPVALGLANNGGVVEILSEPSGNSWTIIITMPSGISCMVATGSAFEVLQNSHLVGGTPASAELAH